MAGAAVIGVLYDRSIDGAITFTPSCGLPSIRAADIVQVRIGSGKLVVSVQFHRHHHCQHPGLAVFRCL